MPAEGLHVGRKLRDVLDAHDRDAPFEVVEDPPDRDRRYPLAHLVGNVAENLHDAQILGELVPMEVDVDGAAPAVVRPERA